MTDRRPIPRSPKATKAQEILPRFAQYTFMSPKSACQSNGFGLVTGTSTPASRYQFSPRWVRMPGVKVTRVLCGPRSSIGSARFMDR
jgi:hypothetical protein